TDLVRRRLPGSTSLTGLRPVLALPLPLLTELRSEGRAAQRVVLGVGQRVAAAAGGVVGIAVAVVVQVVARLGRRADFARAGAAGSIRPRRALLGAVLALTRASNAGVSKLMALAIAGVPSLAEGVAVLPQRGRAACHRVVRVAIAVVVQVVAGLRGGARFRAGGQIPVGAV